ncbi:hypothetical protein D3C78_660840 [compost metagenome]
MGHVGILDNRGVDHDIDATANAWLMVVAGWRQDQQSLAGLHADIDDLQGIDVVAGWNSGRAEHIGGVDLPDLQSDQCGGGAGRQAFVCRTHTTVSRDITPGTGRLQRHVDAYRWWQQLDFRRVAGHEQRAGQCVDDAHQVPIKQ